MAPRMKGKRIGVWTYRDQENGIQYDVPYRMNGMDFFVEIDELGINISDKNLEVLQKKVFAEIAKKLSYAWTPYLYIRVKGYDSMFRPDEDKNITESLRVENSLTVEVETCELALSPSGEKMQRQHSDRWSRRSAHGGWPEVGHEPRRSYYNDMPVGDMRSLVKDTPENRQALNMLFKEMQAVKTRLQELFAPEAAQATLNAIPTRGLLTTSLDEEDV